ncbi:MAG: DNA repair protein RecO [bacterium]
MATLVKSEALILRRFRHGDTSLVLHAFTRSAGRVPFIAKGARAGGRKPPVPLVPAVLLELIWKPSTRSELQLLREWSLLDGFGRIHSDFEKLAWTQAGLEILGRTLTGEQPHEELFDNTLEYIRTIVNAAGRYETLLQRLRLLVLRELGYELDLTVPEGGAGVGRFVPGRGCWAPESGDGAELPVHLGSWKLLAALAISPWDQVNRVRPGREAAQEIEKILDAAYRHAFDRWAPLESLKLLAPIEKSERLDGEEGK